MRKTIALVGAAALGAGLGIAAQPAAAAQSHPMSRSSAIAAADTSLAQHRNAVHASPADAFSVHDVVVDADGASHVHFDRTYHGLAVRGGDVIVHDAPGGAFRAATETMTKPVTVSTSPAIPAAHAASAAAARFRGMQQSATPTLIVDATGPTPRLAWDTVVTGARPDKTPSRLHVETDATTGAPIATWDEIETGTGNGFFNGTVSLSTTLSGSTHQLKDPTRGNNYTTDMNNGTTGNGTLFTDADDVWGTGALTSRQTTAVDAQYGVAETWDYYKNVHGRNGIANNGAGSYNRVHYSSGYDNAFWDDTCFCMTYGDGDGTSYNPFDSLDVAGHEMSHGVTSRTAGLNYSGESGGLNESTSDIFGTAVEFYANNAKDTPDFLIGEKLAKNGTPLRWMDKPSKDGASADCWYSGVGNLDVHYSSGVGNHWFYILSNGTGTSSYGTSTACDGGTNTGIGHAAAERIWYRALTTYMTSTTNYAGARTASLSAAADLYGAGSTNYNAVADAWAAVNVGARVGGGGGGSCTAGQKIANPGFESGATSWTQTSGVIDSSTGEPAHTGSWKAWLDGYGTTHTDTLSQSVTIPSGCTTATLSFYLHIDTAETTTATAYDKLTVQLGGTTLATYSNLNKNTGYVQKSFNVASFAGQTVTLKLTGAEDSSLQTSFVVDDTALNVS